MNKIIFLDIDGPLIPVRAYFLQGQTPVVTLFDPCATSMLNKLLDADTDISIVMSSTHARSGKQHIINLFELNGIDPNRLYPHPRDWMTPRKYSSYRSTEIKWWLDSHPEVKDWVAIDDENLNTELVPNFARCDAYEGFLWRNYLECKYYLKVFDDNEDEQSLTSLVTYFKRRETDRAYQKDSPWGAADPRELRTIITGAEE